MPLFQIATSDGKSILVELPEATAQAVVYIARSQQQLNGVEIFDVRGRNTPKRDVTVPYHAIVSVNQHSIVSVKPEGSAS